MKIMLTILLTVFLTSCTTINPETGKKELTALGFAGELFLLVGDLFDKHRQAGRSQVERRVARERRLLAREW